MSLFEQVVALVGVLSRAHNVTDDARLAAEYCAVRRHESASPITSVAYKRRDEYDRVLGTFAPLASGTEIAAVKKARKPRGVQRANVTDGPEITRRSYSALEQALALAVRDLESARNIAAQIAAQLEKESR